ncbi:MAG: DoxX family protein [Candidatus Liptonbacteria bacterium]|nr:DoxX family protein [Candidatus Liptonbacteria bacterium]
MFTFSLLPLSGHLSILFLRLVLGFVILVHGWPKIKNIRTIGRNFSTMGFHPGFFWGPLVALVEFFGSLALFLGIYTQFVAALFVAEFIVIIVWRFLKRHPFVGGSELDLVILASAFALLALGPGAFSLDYYFWIGL